MAPIVYLPIQEMTWLPDMQKGAKTWADVNECGSPSPYPEYGNIKEFFPSAPTALAETRPTSSTCTTPAIAIFAMQMPVDFLTQQASHSAPHLNDEASSQPPQPWRSVSADSFCPASPASATSPAVMYTSSHLTGMPPVELGCTQDVEDDLAAPISGSNHQLQAQVNPAISQAEQHGSGLCRPCAWFWRPQGCKNGDSCGHCHLCPEGELKQRKKKKIAAMRMGAVPQLRARVAQ